MCEVKKLLITGGSGFMGSRIAAYYKDKYQVFAPNHEEMDITEEESVAAYFEQVKPDLVVHCAAISDVGTCEKNPDLAYKVNVEASVRIARISRRMGAKCLLCSSDQVYVGSPVKEPHKESEELMPGNVYGRGKLEAEKECLKANPDSVSLRLSWMYDTVTMTEKHSDFIRTFVPKLKKGEMLQYSSSDLRGVTDINEVVQNLEAAFELPGGAYNFGAPNVYSFYTTMIKVFETLDLDGKQLQKLKGTAFRNLTMDQTKINDCGIFFSTTLEGLVRNIRAALNSFTS